ncbi:hypothetical protein GCM10010393_38850 [Streptomyces gobitricini]|uniref:Protein-L-isoaspartate O-methyltransferase n=1 Tax=Streptomyces gobitricini TaxID=68211 RepID=A0ABN3MK18_9ACTN
MSDTMADGGRHGGAPSDRPWAPDPTPTAPGPRPPTPPGADVTTQLAGHAVLVESLYERGLLDEPWRAVWHAVPREPFIPRRAWRQDPAACAPLTTEAERLALIHSDEPVVIQLDDGEPDGPGIATSSNSQPSMVARMLRLLQIDGGHRVLEIGTASGYVAALLSRRLGARNVYSVEIDPGLAHHAAAALRAAGYEPNLSRTDGE